MLIRGAHAAATLCTERPRVIMPCSARRAATRRDAGRERHGEALAWRGAPEGDHGVPFVRCGPRMIWTHPHSHIQGMHNLHRHLLLRLCYRHTRMSTSMGGRPAGQPTHAPANAPRSHIPLCCRYPCRCRNLHLLFTRLHSHSWIATYTHFILNMRYVCMYEWLCVSVCECMYVYIYTYIYIYIYMYVCIYIRYIYVYI